MVSYIRFDIFISYVRLTARIVDVQGIVGENVSTAEIAYNTAYKRHDPIR